MTNFDVELQALIAMWLARSYPAQDMIEDMEVEIEKIKEMLASAPSAPSSPMSANEGS